MDSGEGPGGPGSPLTFRPHWGPKGRKQFFLRPPPSYLRVWMTAPPPPLIWRSGSATVAFNFFCPGGRGWGCPWSSHFAYPHDCWKVKSILTSNIRSTNFRRGYTCTAGSKAVDSSHTETKGRPSGQIKAKGHRVRVCDIFNVIKHAGLMIWFLFNNKMCDGRSVSCSSNPGKRCSAVEAICYGKICWGIWSTYKNQI